MVNSVKIERIVSQALTILSKKYTLGESIDCALKLLLFKRLSDLAFTEGTPSFMSENTCWYVIQGEQDNLAQKLNEILIFTEKNSSNLKGVFTNSEPYFWTRFDNETLKCIIQLFSGLDLSNSNLNNSSELDEACEWLLEKSIITGSSRQRAYTPQHITKMMIGLIKPHQNTSIYDPACGSGELLAQTAKFIKKAKGDLSALKLHGQDEYIQEYSTTKANLMLHGVDNPDIRLGNAILEPRFLHDSQPQLFDVVLTNPPFNLKYLSEDIKQLSHPERFPYGIPSNGIGNFLFIQHILSSLKDTGKAVVVLPRGILSSQGDEGEIRRRIVRDNLIEAVIELAPKLFHETSIPVVIGVFNRSNSKRDGILFIDASTEYKAERGHNLLQSRNIERIVSAYHTFEEEEGFSRIVPIEEVAKNEYDLSVNRYVTPLINQEFDITFELSRLHQLETERAELEKEIDGYLENLGIKL
jgi:type I restriction enzyme M protein